MDHPFQRLGADSNARVGSDFEDLVATFFAKQGVELMRNFALSIGHLGKSKRHRFDLGTDDPPMIIECKSHKWTAGGNSPSAKLTVWNEARYFFHLAPARYRKCLCVLLDRHARSNLSLARHYLNNHAHLIPPDVEVWEFDETRSGAERVH